MAATGKPKGQRYSPEQGQEGVSLGQFEERMAKLRWNVFLPKKDLGEDLQVQIFDKGNSTGLSFYVQLKSITDAELFKTKKKPKELRYRLEVKDLSHWEVQSPLVVLVVWDVEARTGYWQPIPRIIDDLDKSNQGWRKKVKVSVSVPLANTTDDEGLKRLRWAVARHHRPLFDRKEPLTFKMTFPATEQGRQGLEALQRALDHGESIVLNKKLVPRIEYPPWHRRLFGEEYSRRIDSIELKPEPVRDSFPVRVEVESREGAASIPYVALRAVRVGRKTAVYSNEHQSIPLTFELELNSDEAEMSFRFSVRDAYSSVFEAKEFTAFLLAVASPERRVRVIDLKSGDAILDAIIPALAVKYDIAEIRRRYELLDKLCSLQPRVSQYGTLSLESGISEKEAISIDQLHRSCKRGEGTQKTIDLSFDVQPSDLPCPQEEEDVRIILDDFKTNILGVDIPIGKVRATICDPARIVKALREATARANATGKPAHVELKELEVVEEYLDWLPTNNRRDRLYKIAEEQAGYFTFSQARAAGYPSEDILVAEERIEPCGGEVYRLVQFPASEHEDLVIIWLQTDRKGVFSHQTALHLHNLSDLLPKKRHITLPEGEEPPQPLEGGVVLHRATLDKREITWMGPVPITKPLRTVRDCIEANVSREFIDQAVEEGIARGLFTREELSPHYDYAEARSA